MKFYSLKSFTFSLSVGVAQNHLTDMKHVLQLSSAIVTKQVLDKRLEPSEGFNVPAFRCIHEYSITLQLFQANNNHLINSHKKYLIETQGKV